MTNTIKGRKIKSRKYPRKQNKIIKRGNMRKKNLEILLRKSNIQITGYFKEWSRGQRN